VGARAGKEQAGADSPPDSGKKIFSDQVLSLLRQAIRIVKVYDTYLASCTAFAIAYFGLAKYLSPVYAKAFAAAPLLPLAVLCVSRLRQWLRRKRRVSAVTRVARYFQMAPRGPDQVFLRGDQAQTRTHNWILSSDEPVLYLTGRSGTGKTSLLKARVLPGLFEAGSFDYILIRDYHDVAFQLAKELNVLGGATLESLYDHLRKVAVGWKQRPFLIVFDDFDKCLATDGRIEAESIEFIRRHAESPLPGIRVLVSLRSEFSGHIKDHSLPGIYGPTNTFELEPFTEVFARDYIAESGLEISAEIMKRLFEEAEKIEQAPGTIRPIVLNMFGMVFRQYAESLPPSQRPGSIIPAYFHEILRKNTEGITRVLRAMLNPIDFSETILVSEEELTEATGLAGYEVRSHLYELLRHGLVRRIAVEHEIWAISHDFVVRLLHPVLDSPGQPALHGLRVTISTKFSLAIILLAVFMSSVYGIYRSHLQEMRKRSEVALRNIDGIEYRRIGGGSAVSFSGDIDSLRDLADEIRELRLIRLELIDVRGVFDLRLLEPFDQLEVFSLRADPASEVPLVNFDSLEKLDALQDLSLIGVTIDDLSSIESLRSLRDLDLSNSQGIRQLPALSESTILETLGLDGTGIEDLSPLSTVLSLQSLHIARTRVKDLSPLAGLISLRVLGVANTEISSVESLEGLRKLECLDLTGTRVAMDEMKSLEEKLPRLKICPQRLHSERNSEFVLATLDVHSPAAPATPPQTR